MSQQVWSFLCDLQDSICAQLWERFDGKAEKHPINSRLAAASVKDLINIEREYLLTQQSYRLVSPTYEHM